MAPINLMQPRLPTTPFEIYVHETQLWVSLLLVDPPTYLFLTCALIPIDEILNDIGSHVDIKACIKWQ